MTIQNFRHLGLAVMLAAMSGLAACGGDGEASPAGNTGNVGDPASPAPVSPVSPGTGSANIVALFPNVASDGWKVTTPLRIANDLGYQSVEGHVPASPAVASDGTNFLVVAPAPPGLYKRLLGPQGNVLQNVTPLSSNPPFSSVAMAFDGVNYLTARTTPEAGFNIWLERYSPSNLQIVSPSTGFFEVDSGTRPAVARGLHNSLVVYRRGGAESGLYGSLVVENGMVESAFQIAAGANHVLPGVGFDGINYLVVWQVQPDTSDGSGADILGARISSHGTLLDATPIVISVATNGQFLPAVAFDGTNYLVAWEDARNSPSGEDARDVYAARVTPAGQLLDPDGFVIDSGSGRQRTHAAVACTGPGCLVVWTDNEYRADGTRGIALARVAPDGVVTSGASALGAGGLQSGSFRQMFPVLAAGSGSVAVAWVDYAGQSGAASSLMAAIIYPP